MPRWLLPAWRQAVRTAYVRWPIILLALLAGGTALGADDPPPEFVFRDNTEGVLAGAATLAGAGGHGGAGTTLVLGLLVQGDRQHLWKLQASDKALPLSPRLLKHVKDSTSIRVDDAAFEPEAYCEAVFKASLTTVDAFANSAFQGLTFADLFTEPQKWRGKVVHYEGKVRSIHRFDAPLLLRGKGIEDLYACWVFGTQDGSNHPVCLVCTELPAGVSPGEHLDRKVSFDAYFFKRYRYEAVGSKRGQAQEAPLFIGRSFVPVKPQEDGAASQRAEWKTFLLIFLGAVLTTFVLAFLAHWWFRHSDRRVQARIREARAREYTDAS
jgi:hypothetical protein